MTAARPWYKRPMFWILVVVSLCIIGAMQDDKPAPAPAAAQSSPNDVYREPAPEPKAEPAPVVEQPKAEPEPAPVERTPLRTPLNNGNIQINGNGNKVQVEYHLHKHPKRRDIPVNVYPIMRHEMIIVPSDGSNPVVFADIAPPRVAVVDKEISRAYAAHMLKLAKQYGTPTF